MLRGRFSLEREQILVHRRCARKTRFRLSLWEIPKSGLGDRGEFRTLSGVLCSPSAITKELTMSTSKQDAQAARARAIAEALQSKWREKSNGTAC